MPKESNSARSAQIRGIEFCINGEKHTVSDKFPADTSLADYIRDVAGLTGTKVMCREGGCGCCVVAVTRPLGGKGMETFSINSCLCPLYSVDGWQIATVEGIGNSRDGFHPIQQRLAQYSGTQCGFCSPGFVMSMYGLMHRNHKATQQAIEDSFDGHICRCTGYRPILDAMKSFAMDSCTGDNGLDIEDLNKHLCPQTGQVCQDPKGKETPRTPRYLSIDLPDHKSWYRPLSLKELSGIVKQHSKNGSIKLIHGNTGAGIYKQDEDHKVYIDLKAVQELHVFEENDAKIVFGGGTTLTELRDRLLKLADKPGFHYCERMAGHLKGVASLLIRNSGSIAGNLMVKHGHRDFPSDVFTVLEAVGTILHVYDSLKGKTTKMTLTTFLSDSMKNKVLAAMEMPKWKDTDLYRSFKVAPRWQNAHAYVTAAFKIPVQGRQMVGKPNIVVGGINEMTVHASRTEEFLSGKLLDDQIINEAVHVMAGEMEPSDGPLLASPQYRKDVATNLLYKTLLEVYKPDDPVVQSGAGTIQRPLSSGMFTFQEKPEDFPMKQPLAKKTAPLQVSGEAQFVGDIPKMQHELVGALVGTSIARGHITNIDPTEALLMPGVVRFLDARDIPKGGVNSCIPNHPFFSLLHQELFCDEDVGYEGQVVGLILAESRNVAEKAATKVMVDYQNVTTPLVDLEEAIGQGNFLEGGENEFIRGDVEAAFKEAAHVVEGEVREGLQYHFFLETITGLAVPTEDGLDLHVTTQAANVTQEVVARVLAKPCNYVNITVPRLGGGFGGKMFNSIKCASMCALASEVVKRPVRVTYDLSTNMKVNERRFGVYAKYKACCDSDGKMLAVDIDYYVDVGYCPTFVGNIDSFLDMGFHIPNWRIRRQLVKTNKSMAGACRAPASVPASLIIETVMEHLAKARRQHSILFKEMNLYQEGQEDHMGIRLTYCSLTTLWNRLKQTSEVTKRMEEVEAFNKTNLWRKKGLTMCAIKYKMDYLPMGYPTAVSIFAGDGTVTVSTSGVEMGQGLHMKVAQAVAKTLGVTLDQVKVRPSVTNFLPNAQGTGGSTTSERAVASAIAACQKILDGLQPIREKMEGSSWQQLLLAATFYEIPLYATVDASKPGPMFKYFTYMTGVVETEVDALTGEFQVSRVDIMADFGESLNPIIDLGQVEGAFVMGLGAYLSEEHVFDKATGRLLNDGTWEYKPPTCQDIPIDWRIHFLVDAPNPDGVLSSKATGEPPIGLAVGALLAIKSSVEQVREQLTQDTTFLNVEAPFTVEKVQQAANIQLQHLHTTAPTIH